MIDANRENGLKEPSVLERLDAIDALVAEYRSSGAKLSHTSSLVDIVKETHQALNANDANAASAVFRIASGWPSTSRNHSLSYSQ